MLECIDVSKVQTRIKKSDLIITLLILIKCD